MYYILIQCSHNATLFKNIHIKLYQHYKKKSKQMKAKEATVNFQSQHRKVELGIFKFGENCSHAMIMPQLPWQILWYGPNNLEKKSDHILKIFWQYFPRKSTSLTRFLSKGFGPTTNSPHSLSFTPQLRVVANLYQLQASNEACSLGAIWCALRVLQHLPIRFTQIVWCTSKSTMEHMWKLGLQPDLVMVIRGSCLLMSWLDT